MCMYNFYEISPLRVYFPSYSTVPHCSVTYSQIEAIKAARHSCTAYVLQILALEIRTVEGSPSLSSMKLRETLDLLFHASRSSSPTGRVYRGPISHAPGPGPRGLPVMTIFNMAVDLPVLSLPSISSPIIIRCLSAASVPYTVSRGGQASPTGDISAFLKIFFLLRRN
jgi:hypothetical protein